MKRLKVLVSVVLLTGLAWRTDWGQVRATFAHLQLDLWLGAVGLYLFAQLCSSLRWQLLARPLGFTQPLRYFLGFYFIGMFFNLVLPTSVGGDVVRAMYLERPGRRLAAFVSVLVERGSGLMVLIFLACAALAATPLTLPAWVPLSVWGSAIALTLGLATLLARYHWRAAEPDGPRADDPRAVSRSSLVMAALGMVEASLLTRPGLLLATTGLSLLVQVANILLVWLVGLAIGAPVPAMYYWIVVPMVSLLTVVLPSLNGHGVREGGLILFLAEVGVPPSTALTLSFLWFAVMACTSLGGGLVYLFGRFPRPEVDPNDATLGHSSDQGRAGQYQAAA